jgi:hypothetical protein
VLKSEGFVKKQIEPKICLNSTFRFVSGRRTFLEFRFSICFKCSSLLFHFQACSLLNLHWKTGKFPFHPSFSNSNLIQVNFDSSQNHFKSLNFRPKSHPIPFPASPQAISFPTAQKSRNHSGYMKNRQPKTGLAFGSTCALLL